MGGDRRQHDGPQSRREHGAPGRQVVGGGSGGRRHEQSVGAVGDEGTTVDGGLDAHRVTGHGLLHRGLVEGGPVGRPFAVGSGDGDRQRHPLLHLVGAGEKSGQGLLEPVRLDLSQVAQPPDVDAEDGNALLEGRLDRAQQRPVAAQADQQVGSVDRHRTVGLEGGHRLVASLDQPGSGAVGQGGRLGSVRIGVEGDQGHGSLPSLLVAMRLRDHVVQQGGDIGYGPRGRYPRARGHWRRGMEQEFDVSGRPGNR